MLLSHQLTIYEKKNQTYQYLFYDYHVFYISATVWDTSTSISNSIVFLHILLDPRKESRFDISNPRETFVLIQLLEIDFRTSLFSDISCAKRENF